MNSGAVPVFYGVVAIASVWLGLLYCARVRSGRRARLVMLCIGAAAGSLLVVPLGGLALWSRAFSFFPNPSVPLLGIVCAALWQRTRGRPIFNARDWTAIWCFGAIGGTVLYLHPMIHGGVDLYFWGWDRQSAVYVFAALAVVLLACGSRLGVLLLAALIAYAANALESRNGWDYIMDPIFWLISVGAIGLRAVGFAYRRARSLFSNGNSAQEVSRPPSGAVG